MIIEGIMAARQKFLLENVPKAHGYYVVGVSSPVARQLNAEFARGVRTKECLYFEIPKEITESLDPDERVIGVLFGDTIIVERVEGRMATA